ncbi:hypothetical protein [Phenylobacterium montanum]|uniref:Uncharacterized protein n=1 Tax=Phenylobacterium montanum TaxID=2823693 RepID=A0A975G3F5_9CAUL|nr:hypothetical protein [Caulobacter sp. S6]QUD89857.1 hypothetical protein KCG34_08300 [Caulobacter sp. S6]
MLAVGADRYNIQGAVGALPILYNEIVERAELHDNFGVGEADGEPVFIAVTRDDAGWPYLALSLRCMPIAGFNPGVFLIPETDVLLIGSGERLLAYDLKAPRKLWEDSTMCGFWRWSRHADIVLMSAELELAAYSLQGERLWSRLVEPPWDYSISGAQIHLDVMGKKSEFSLVSGA